MFITEATLFSVMVSPTLGHCEQQTLSLVTTHMCACCFQSTMLKNL